MVWPRCALSAAGLLDVAALECALEAGVYDTRPQGMTIFTTSIILLFYNTYFTLYSPSPDRIIQYYLTATRHAFAFRRTISVPSFHCEEKTTTASNSSVLEHPARLFFMYMYTIPTCEQSAADSPALRRSCADSRRSRAMATPPAAIVPATARGGNNTAQ